ncbi:MAG TPA: glycogen/starch synthase [Gemmatimonadales bacterium]|nr:glycogen/starch synthase [Gemmatimonadales bacterium]
MKTRVLHLTAELWPYARTGGLGQAVSGLANYQASVGTESHVVLPLYREARAHVGRLEPLYDPFTVDSGGRREEVRCWRKADDAYPKTLLLEHEASFNRPGIYGDANGDYPDNHRRFALFASAAIEIARRIGDGNLILHAHDWHASLVPVFLRRVYRDDADLQRLPCVLTVHNGGFQGVFPPHVLRDIHLPEDLWSPNYMEWYGRLNYLKGGLVCADMVSTVSPTHASELLTDVGGFGLQHTFRQLGDRLVGIRNGIDVDEWNPRNDPQIAAPFWPEEMSGKVRCKAALQEAWGLPRRPGVPLFGMSARLVAQKGLDQIVASQSLRRLDAQFIFLGAGEAQFENALRDLGARYPDRVALNTAFTDPLEHQVLAGADFLMMPSLYEPCGLTQMRAQLYGALPVARHVGGLADTIEDGVTGILYDAYSPAAFDQAIQRAVTLYQDRVRFTELARGAMRKDFSWARPAKAYAAVYRRARAARAIARSASDPSRADGGGGARTPRKRGSTTASKRGVNARR